MDERFHPAMVAVYSGDLAKLEEMLVADPSLAKARSSCSHPSLLQLVAVDHVPRATEAAEMLLRHGADQVQEAVMAAASTAAEDVLWLLVEEHGGRLDVGEWRPLHEALYWSHTEFAERLRDGGAPIDRLRAAAGLGDLDAMAGFFEGEALTANAGPISGPFADRVDPTLADDPQHLLDHALVTATLNARVDAMAWLVDHGASPSGKPTGFHWAGNALHAAIWRGDVDIVRWLIDQGADPSVRDDSYDADARGWAEHHKHADVIALLD